MCIYGGGRVYCVGNTANIKTELIRSWKRYLDDYFNGLYNLLSNLLPKIKFIIEHNFKELLFLDILVKNQMAKL